MEWGDRPDRRAGYLLAIVFLEAREAEHCCRNWRGGRQGGGMGGKESRQRRQGGGRGGKERRKSQILVKEQECKLEEIPTNSKGGGEEEGEDGVKEGED